MAEKKKPPPGQPPETADGSDKPSLEEFLVACQKSFARSAYAAEQASKADISITQGERNFYAVDFLDFTVAVALDTEGENRDRVRLDFEADPARRSSISFRLEAKPRVFIQGAHLQLANLDPLEQHLPDSHLRLWLVDNNNIRVPDYKVTLEILKAGTRDPMTAEAVDLTTDAAGRINFWIRPWSNEVEVLGGERVKIESLGGPEDYFVSASCNLQYPFAEESTPLRTEFLRLRAGQSEEQG